MTDVEHAQELEFLLYRLASESREQCAWDSLLRAIQVLTGVGHVSADQGDMNAERGEA